jgi:hypothetical protein
VTHFGSTVWLYLSVSVRIYNRETKDEKYINIMIMGFDVKLFSPTAKSVKTFTMPLALKSSAGVKKANYGFIMKSQNGAIFVCSK